MAATAAAAASGTVKEKSFRVENVKVDGLVGQSEMGPPLGLQRQVSPMHVISSCRLY